MVELVDFRMETDRKEFDDAGVKTDDVEIKEFSA